MKTALAELIISFECLFVYLFFILYFAFCISFFYILFCMRVCQPRRLQNLENYMQAATHYARRDNNISIGEKLHT